MRSLAFFAGLLALSAMLLSGCASRPSIDYDPDFDFAVVQSFSVVDPAAAQTGDPRLDSPLINQRIHAAIASVLDSRGYRNDSEAAHVSVHYHVGKRSGIESRSSGVSMGMGTYRRGSGAAIGYNYPAYDVVSYDEGILTIDMIDPADNTLVWRGSSSRRLSEGGATPEATTKAVNDVVAEILQEFPPGRGQQ